MDDTQVIESIVRGVVKDPKSWKKLLPDFLNEIYKSSSESSQNIARKLAESALQELDQAEYDRFVEAIMNALVDLPEEVRHAVFTSRLTLPAGLPPEQKEKVYNGYFDFYKKLLLGTRPNRTK